MTMPVHSSGQFTLGTSDPMTVYRLGFGACMGQILPAQD